MQQQLAAAYAALYIRQCFRDQLRAHFALAEWLVAHQVFQLLHILYGVVEEAFAFHAVAACTAGFLVVVL